MLAGASKLNVHQISYPSESKTRTNVNLQELNDQIKSQ